MLMFISLVITSCDNDNTILENQDIELAVDLDSIEPATLGKFTECSRSIDAISYSNYSQQLEIVWSLAVDQSGGTPPPPGLMLYEFEFIFGSSTTYHTVLHGTAAGSYSEFFYWQFLTKGGQQDGEVRIRLKDCGNGSVGEWSDTVKIII